MAAMSNMGLGFLAKAGLPAPAADPYLCGARQQKYMVATGQHSAGIQRCETSTCKLRLVFGSRPAPCVERISRVCTVAVAPLMAL